MNGSARRLVRHYLEMVLAMVAGMLLVYPLLDLAVGARASRIEVDAMLMASSMSLTMAGWMRFRGHRTRPILEMSLAMYAGFVVLFPLLWSEHLTADGLMTGGHILMLVFMLAGMLARPREYIGHTHAPQVLLTSGGKRRLSGRESS